MSEHKKFMSKMRYINEIMGCSCFPNLLEMKIFPNAKEITESSAIFNYLRNINRDVFALDDKEVTFVCVGDGVTPRTAAMFAFRTAWDCYSIDPEMTWENNGRVRRLTCIRDKVENLEPRKYRKLVIAHVHSHARLQESCRVFKANQRVVIAMPCCVKQERHIEPDLEYTDNSVWSPKNKIKVWLELDGVPNSACSNDQGLRPEGTRRELPNTVSTRFQPLSHWLEW